LAQLSAKVGDRPKGYETGKIHEVKMTTGQRVVVQAVGELSQMMTSWKVLKSLCNIHISKAQ